MRHDWTLLCAELLHQEHGSISLGKVFTRLRVPESHSNIAAGDLLTFNQAILLVSHWTPEFDSDRGLHAAIVQLLAPDGDLVLWEDKLEFDVRGQTSFRMIYVIPNLEYVGKGTYEFHVFLDALGPIGEWGRACLTVS